MWRGSLYASFAAQEAHALKAQQEDRRCLRRFRRIPGLGYDAGAAGLGDAGPVRRLGTAGLPDRLDHHAGRAADPGAACMMIQAIRDRKSTRLNSSHTVISYAVFCLK